MITDITMTSHRHDSINSMSGIGHRSVIVDVTFDVTMSFDGSNSALYVAFAEARDMGEAEGLRHVARALDQANGVEPAPVPEVPRSSALSPVKVPRKIDL